MDKTPQAFSGPPRGDNTDALSALRAKIDAIDESMHSLLMQRGKVVDQLIEAKGTASGGTAFRPGREAQMMRAFVERHNTDFPLTVIEHIWREIIGTFTQLQAPYSAHIDAADDAIAMQDVARFHFGFSLNMTMRESANEVVEAVNTSGSDLGLISLAASECRGAWWRELGTKSEIIALLPFIQNPERAYSKPCCTIAPPLTESGSPENTLFAASIEDNQILRKHPDVSLMSETHTGGEVLFGLKTEDMEHHLGSLAQSCDLQNLQRVGSYATPIVLSNEVNP